MGLDRASGLAVRMATVLLENEEFSVRVSDDYEGGSELARLACALNTALEMARGATLIAEPFLAEIVISHFEVGRDGEALNESEADFYSAAQRLFKDYAQVLMMSATDRPKTSEG